MKYVTSHDLRFAGAQWSRSSFAGSTMPHNATSQGYMAHARVVRAYEVGDEQVEVQAFVGGGLRLSVSWRRALFGATSTMFVGLVRALLASAPANTKFTYSHARRARTYMLAVVGGGLRVSVCWRRTACGATINGV